MLTCTVYVFMSIPVTTLWRCLCSMPCYFLTPSWKKPTTEKITALFPILPETQGDDLPPECKVNLFSSLNALGWNIRKKGGGGGGSLACDIDSISMTTNTLKYNKPMLQVPIPFQGLKWPCRYLQITALHKAALSGAICQWPRGRKKNRRQQT